MRRVSDGRRLGFDLVAAFAFPAAFGRAVDGRLLGVNGSERFRQAGFMSESGDAVLRALGAGEAWLDRGEIESNDLGERRRRRAIGAEQALLLGVALDEIDFGLGAAGSAQVAQRFIIDREEAHRRAVFGRHVADRRPVGEGHRRDAGAEELDELADDAFFAQHLRHREHQIGRGGAGRQVRR